MNVQFPDDSKLHDVYRVVGSYLNALGENNHSDTTKLLQFIRDTGLDKFLKEGRRQNGKSRTTFGPLEKVLMFHFIRITKGSCKHEDVILINRIMIALGYEYYCGKSKRFRQRVENSKRKCNKRVYDNPDVNPEVNPEIHPEVNPGINCEANPEIHPEVNPEVHPEVHPEIHPEIHPEVNPEIHPEIHPEVNLDIDYDVGPINHTNPTAIHPNDQPTEDQSSLSREFFNKMSLGLQNAFNHAIEESIEELSFNNNLFYEGCWL